MSLQELLAKNILCDVTFRIVENGNENGNRQVHTLYAHKYEI